MDERQPTLLVIEDAEDQALLVGVAARNALPGLEVHIAEDGAQGIAYLSGIEPLADPPSSATPNLVILDLRMPVVDGFGVLEWMRQELGEEAPPVVVLTSSRDPADEQRARELGAADLVEKPQDPDSLCVSVREIVTRWIDPGDILAAHMRWAG